VPDSTTDRRWLADSNAKLVWRHWGDAHFAFDPRSHQTHFLNTLAVEVVDILDDGPRTVAEILRALTERHDVEDEDDALLEAIQSSLNILDRLGIVRRAS